MESIKNKKILVLGGTGSLGNSLTEYYRENNKIVVFSRDENKQWSMKLKYRDVNFFIGDIRDYSSIKKCIDRYSPEIVILAAALKHIDICEENIEQCIQTNINGVLNTIKAVNDSNSVEKLVFISTDKSALPINVYGMCKSISERLISDASRYSKKTFINVRYGNVINSRGSILEKYNSIARDKTKSFEVTNKDMTRFFMTLEDSVKLIDTALINGTSGDTWVPHIKAFRIIDIARLFSAKYGNSIIVTDTRPGEKMNECLISLSETHRTTIYDKEDSVYYTIKPVFSNKKYCVLEQEYTSRETYPIDHFEKMITI